MPVAYNPTEFWNVLFAQTGSAIPKALPSSMAMLPLAVAAQVFNHYEYVSDPDLTSVLLPISLLVGLLMSLRITDAFGKWNRASGHVLAMHAVIRNTISKLLAYVVCPPERMDELTPQLEEIRRLLVLAAVLIKKHVRGESKFEEEAKRGLITAEEVHSLQKVVFTVSCLDGKKDKYPPRNRVSFVIDLLHRETFNLHRTGFIGSFNHHLAIDAGIEQLSALLEECEHLGVTLLPIPYAQASALVRFSAPTSRRCIAAPARAPAGLLASCFRDSASSCCFLIQFSAIV
mmetsp:Transcript_19055/g.56857  ORF Transcript_19055/g.56857 Transcript_19055/m.56857 type:complete len:288 (-) Transcript_19055:1577-2440(-)